MTARDHTTGLHVVLVEPEIPWNTGNSGRSCLAAGATLHLVGELGFSLADKQVRRSGLDYWARVEHRTWHDWKAFENELPVLGNPVFLTPEATRPLWDVDLTVPTCLIFGSESQGLSGGLRRRFADHRACLPQVAGSVRSLNLSTTVGIALWEALRQRRQR